MAKFTYPYQSFHLVPSEVNPAGSLLYRPQLVATVTAAGASMLRWPVVLDSGAGACIFPLALAIALDIDVLSLPRTMTVGVGSQTNVTYYANVTIDLGNGLVFMTNAGFTHGMDTVGIGLLGQQGFFDRFNVEFRHSEDVFTVEPATPSTP